MTNPAVRLWGKMRDEYIASIVKSTVDVMGMVFLRFGDTYPYGDRCPDGLNAIEKKERELPFFSDGLPCAR